MRRKSHKAPERLYAVLVEAVAAEGKCIVRTEEGVIFVENPTGGPGVAPGDVVDLRVTNRKKQYREAVAERIHEFSTVRAKPFCAHFGTCGGCKWQHIQYDEQLRFKHQQVVDHLTRIGKVDLPTIRPIMAAEPTQYYRNKLEFTCAEGRWITHAEAGNDGYIDPRAVGFHVPGRFDKVLPIRHCYLQPDPSNAIRLAVAEYAFQHDMTLYNLKVHTGFLRTLIIRTASSGQLMVTVQVAKDEPERLAGLLTYLQTTFPQITSLNYIINTKKNDSYQDQDVLNWSGKPYIEELMDDGSNPDGEPLTFRVGPKSFYQTNAQQAYNLYKVARDWAGLTGRERVYDLYTGTGTIALFVARRAKHVVGVEYVEASVADARVNAEVNGITNTTFVAGDMRDILTDGFFDQHGRPDVVITDPPRAGMDEAVTRQLLKAAPERIVYVSCNTATQARDLGILDEGYRVADVQPVDMFPHTHHVENVVLLVKK
ncbi:23S rRNA (uracil(1939)-C(5))-methyltransferase RlmD [Spirosoma agri]|uniref:23S rRNA (Uracil(1939)-C(5))-methyltransferase RlmD n=1 Tax=Spirosoma agri TaxID=1987381 RepID=A0A6M0IIR5_9BACT|nr:23S rRNA (uracil(1939)-C(5))-methyltransferase RlmD [Spirosoma agri]NEU67747.1 23S rRNA (uracil(1939)-C(5))-methyltransferase RlmD [Spirosoma agri]